MWAFDRGLPEVDFLCGDEPYKFRFADARTELASFVGARTLLGRGALLAGERMERFRRPHRCRRCGRGRGGAGVSLSLPRSGRLVSGRHRPVAR